MKQEDYNQFGMGNIFTPINTGVVNPATMITVHGQTVNSDGEIEPYVSVVIAGTATGVMSDEDGYFTLNNVPQNGEIDFTHSGVLTVYPAKDVNGKVIVNTGLSSEVDLGIIPGKKSSFYKYAIWAAVAAGILYLSNQKSSPAKSLAGPRKPRAKRKSSKKTHVKVKL